MARNIEIKARVQDVSQLRSRIAAICLGKPLLLIQCDTFHDVPKGRLKLRETQDSTAELIFYERPDHAGPKVSSYTVTPVIAASMHELLRRFVHIRAVVSKRRE